MGTSSTHAFKENDIQLLKTGNFADGTVKCQDRTWDVHRPVLASRLKFFRAAFYGSFAEASAREVNFPDHDPDSVNIMLRHLYREDLDVKDLKTPALCVRCWRLADYLRFETLKQVAMSSLQDHLDAMALLASCNGCAEGVQPNWLTYLLEAFREVCLDETTKPLHNTFAAFLLVTRFEVLTLPQTLDVLDDCHGLCQSLLKVLVWSAFEDQPTWIPNNINIKVIQTTKRPTFTTAVYCDVCDKDIDPDKERVFWDPFPANPWAVRSRSTWCKWCAAKFSEECCWPWRSGRGTKEGKVKLEAWAWSDDE